MRQILHIITREPDELAKALVASQRALPETRVDVVSLHEDGADYTALAEKIFAADSVEVW